MSFRKSLLIFIILILFEKSNGFDLTTIVNDDVDIFKFENEKKDIENIDVIQLNIGGEIIVTTRYTLTRIPKSILAILFNGRWEHRLAIDENENLFFDFNPILFRHLIDQLQIFDGNQIFPPENPSIVRSFKKMLRKLALDQLLLLSEKKVFTFNIGGQLITLKQNLSSENRIDQKSDIFIDSNPKLYQYLIKQLRTNQCYLEVPSIREKNIFQNLIKNLNISQKVAVRFDIDKNTKWIQNGVTIAGNQSNQLSGPHSISVDHDDQSIYIADYDNHRIVQWKCNTDYGEIVAGGNGQGNRNDQLNHPRDLIMNKKSDSLIICDYTNRRIVQWSRQNRSSGEIIISNVDCWSVTIDKNENIYVADWKKDEIRRWKKGDSQGIIVAGGNGQGSQLNQFDYPNLIVVDDFYSIYVSDWKNHRIMKWLKGAKEGIIVAGGRGEGNTLRQLSYPQGILLDHLGNIYISDCRNHRIVRWSPNDKEGILILGGTDKGKQLHQFDHPIGLAFDRFHNIYVADYSNNRIQTFFVDFNSFFF